MTITVNIHGFKTFAAHAWHYGTTSALVMKIIQEDGESIAFTLYVRDGSYARAAAIAHALNGAGEPPSAYDPELDGLDVPVWPDFTEAIDEPANEYVRDDAQFGVGA